MGDEFYAIIKLVSGEEILSLVMVDDNDGDTVLVLQNPITINFVNSPNGTFIKVKSWMELTEDNFFIIKPNSIITMTETKEEKLIDIYQNYLEEEDDDESESLLQRRTLGGSKVKPDSKMGYITSVNKARERLEKIFKEIKES